MTVAKVPTLVELLRGSQRLAPSTKRCYEPAIRSFVSFAGDAPSGWSPVVVETWRDHLRVQEGFTDKNANFYLYALRFVAKRWEDLGLGPNFARSAEPIRIDQAPSTGRDGLTAKELARLIAAASGRTPPDLRDRALIVIGVRAGGRRVAELAGLHWERIDGDRATFRVKGRRWLEVVFDDECRRVLRPWHRFLGQPTTGPVFRSLRYLVDDKWHAGSRISPKAIYQIIVKRGQEAELTRRVHPHLLRNTFINMALDAGIKPHQVMLQTGHTSLASLSFYIRRSLDRATAADQFVLPSFMTPEED